MGISEKKHEMIFTARMNTIYHESIERYCYLLINFTGVLSVTFSGAIISDMTNVYVLSIGSCLVFIANGFILSFGILQKIYEHRILKNRWIDILSMVELSDNINSVKNEVCLIEKDEPAANKILLDKAYKATCVAMDLKIPIRK